MTSSIFKEWRGALLEGAASVFDIYPQMMPRAYRPENDRKNLASDWNRIGRDFSQAIDVEKEYATAAGRK